MEKLIRSFSLVFFIPILLVFQGCGGSSGGGGGPDTPVANVSGEWRITETMGSNTCDEAVGYVDVYSLQVTLSGNALTVVSPAGTFSGTLDGNKIEWTGSYPEDGGTTTILSMNITVSADGNSLSGTTSWRWTDGAFTCSGTTSVSGTRISGPVGRVLDSPIADVTGQWSITEAMGSNNCGDTVGEIQSYNLQPTLSGNALTVVAPAGTFTGTLDGNKIEWTGSYPEDGGTTTILSMDVTVSNDGNSLSGTTLWSWTDGTFTCSGTTSVNGARTSGPGGGSNMVNESEPNDDFNNADSVGTDTVSGNTNSSTDESDWFEFSAPSSGTYSFTLTWASRVHDLDLGLTTATDECISDAEETTSEFCSLPLAAGETVLILVKAFDTGGITVNYTLEIQ